jgi:hypothetical protein
MNSKKLKELQTKKKAVQEKLKNLYLNFRGVRHESSSDEMKYTQIKVLEAYIESLEAEIKSMLNIK